MTLTRHEDWVRDHIQQDPEYARLMREFAIELLDGNDEDRQISLRILRDGFGLSEDEIQAIQAARKDATRDAAYFVRFGTYKLDACDYDAAIANYDRAIALEPDDADAYHNRGIAKDAQGDYAAAIADFNRAIALEPDDADAYHNRGIAKDAQGDYAAAIADFDRAIALEPDDADVYHNRGVAKAEQGDYAGAIADYDRVIALDPDNVAVLEDRAVAIAGQNGHTVASADYGVDAEFGALEHEEAAV